MKRHPIGCRLLRAGLPLASHASSGSEHFVAAQPSLVGQILQSSRKYAHLEAHSRQLALPQLQFP